MILDELRNISQTAVENNVNDLVTFESFDLQGITVYPKSVNEINEIIFFIGIQDQKKFLFAPK